jgi:hypothetical protein
VWMLTYTLMSGETLCNDEKAVSHMLPYMFGSLGKTRAVLLHHPLIDNPHVQEAVYLLEDKDANPSLGCSVQQ